MTTYATPRNELKNMDLHDLNKTQKNFVYNVNKNVNNDLHDFKNKTINATNKEVDFINVMYTNADSLTNKMDEIETYAKLYNADLILITEYLSKNPSSNFTNIYNIDGFNCLENNVGRGVCVFYNNKFEVKEHEFINKMYSPSIFFNIKTTTKPMNIGLIYRSPNSSEEDNKKVNNQLNFASKN